MPQANSFWIPWLAALKGDVMDSSHVAMVFATESLGTTQDSEAGAERHARPPLFASLEGF